MSSEATEIIVHEGRLGFIGQSPCVMRAAANTVSTDTSGFIPYRLMGKMVRITIEVLPDEPSFADLTVADKS